MPLGTITTWDKRFNGVNKDMQQQVFSHPKTAATVLDTLKTAQGSIRLLYSGNGDGVTTEVLAGNLVCEGEFVAIPEGGEASVKYCCGKFVTANNLLATTAFADIVLTKYLYYWLKNNINLVSRCYRGSGVQHPDMSAILNLMVPIPSIQEQKQIIDILDYFDSLCNDLTTGLPAEIKAREKQYQHYRDKLLSFKE